MKFEFATAGRILFGSGSSEQLPSLAQGLGGTALLVLGRSRRHGEALSARLAASGVRSLIFSVAAEPTTHLVDEAAAEDQGANTGSGEPRTQCLAMAAAASQDKQGRTSQALRQAGKLL